MSNVSLTTHSPRVVLTRFHRAMLNLSAVDALYEFPLLTPGRPARYHGREAIRAGFRTVWGASPVRVEEVRNVVIYETTDPELIVAEQEVAATATTTSRPFAVASLLIMRVQDGLI